MKSYDHKKIEKKWQKEWSERSAYKAHKDTQKQKRYILDMFPYPSGSGLHVGHPRGYIATDIYSRFLRMSGYNVLHPMGWDAFGLPAENFAIKNKVHPKTAVKKNIKRYKTQLTQLGLSYDWDREIDTTDPEYYKWTQWIFLQMYKNGLAYESHEPINWCPSCKTGLANEDLEDGLCERCGSEVEQKPLRQWVLKITDYADRLLDDLETLPDWPESVKESQRNWIGRSEGARISFSVVSYKQVLFASNNTSKRDRVQWLLQKAGIDVEILLPKEAGLTEESVPEDARSLYGNATQKARAYQGKTKLPILASDTGFYIKGEDLDPVRVKRNALKEGDEDRLSNEAIAKKITAFYTSYAKKNGGEVEAEWRDAWVFLLPDGRLEKQLSKRPVVLTDKRKGKVDTHFPIRGLYYSKVTGKRSSEQSDEEELQELAPIQVSLEKLLTTDLQVFTTRPDTLFGATYMVLAPEHELLDDLWESVENKKQVKDYIDRARKKTELQRTKEAKKKTGVELQGIQAVNPATKEAIPVWVADYVMVHYGTGAIMAVPAHDERDFEFALQKELPVRYVVHPKRVDRPNPPRAGKKTVERRTIHALVSDPKSGKMLFLKWKKHPWTTLIVGGVDNGEDVVTAARREVEEETGYTDLELKKVSPFPVEGHYFAAHKDENRKAVTTAVHFELKSAAQKPVAQEEKDKHEAVWLDLDAVADTLTCAELDVWREWLRNGGDYPYADRGILMDSGPFSGMESAKAKAAIRRYVKGKKETTYKLKDWVFSRQRYWGEPIPLIHCDQCGVVPVPEKDLPVTLPQVRSYEPTGTGESPLASIKSWVNVKCPECGEKAHRETNTMPQWAGSCWYYLRFTDPHNKKDFADTKEESYWMPVDMYVGGIEHATRHLIYARFWHKFLYDMKQVSTNEPFSVLRNQGLITGSDGRKMSKRWGNVVNPDDVVERYGADTLRVYEMFMGPFESEVAWSTNGVMGARRFLERVWRVAHKAAEGAEKDRKLTVTLNKTIQKVGDDIERFSFNTCVSSLMILVNEMDERDAVPLEYVSILVRLLAPFAPHISEELWVMLGGAHSIHEEPWPEYDSTALIEDTVTLAVQINGKVRSEIEVARDSSEEDVVALAKDDERTTRWLEGGEIRKVIYIPNRILNIVVN